MGGERKGGRRYRERVEGGEEEMEEGEEKGIVRRQELSRERKGVSEGREREGWREKGKRQERRYSKKIIQIQRPY